MPVLFILALLMLGIAVIAGIVAALSSEKAAAAGVAGLTGLMGVLFVIFASVNVVPTRNVGIVTSFNKPTGEVTGAGLQWTKPWENVDDWDASRQSFDRRDKSCVSVRISGLQNACVDVLVEWTTDPDRAPEQWASYKRSFDNFVSKRVEPNITGAINDAFGDHNPLANVDSATGQVQAPDTKPLVERIRANIVERIGPDVKIQSIVVGFIRYDDKVQAAIEAYQQKILAHTNLLQDEKNAQVAKRVTETNAQVDPVTRCLEIADRKGGEPGFCLGGGNPVQTRTAPPAK